MAAIVVAAIDSDPIGTVIIISARIIGTPATRDVGMLNIAVASARCHDARPVVLAHNRAPAAEIVLNLHPTPVDRADLSVGSKARCPAALQRNRVPRNRAADAASATARAVSGTIGAGMLRLLLGMLLLVLVLRLMLSMLGLLLSVLRLLSVRLLLGMLRLLLRVLWLLLSVLRLLSMLWLLLMLRLLLSMLRLLLSVLRLLLSMLRFRSGVLFVLGLLFALRRVAKSNCSEKHEQEKCCVGTSQSFHRLCLTIQSRAWQRS